MGVSLAGGPSKGKTRAVPMMNVTPLVDVVLVLLIIFMVVTPMLQEGVDVALPTGPHAEQKPGTEHDLLIAIKLDGTRWCFGNNANGELGTGTSWREQFTVIP